MARPRPSDEPTLYERVMRTKTTLARVTVVKSRSNGHTAGWWAFCPPLGARAVTAPTHARVLELAEEEWGT